MPQIQPPTDNSISQGRHGNFNAVDYRARTNLSPLMNRKNIYAVEDGTITKYSYEGTMGNRLELTSADGKRRWGMGHLESAVVVSGAVKRGQLIGVMGHTGLTKPSGYFGTHLHLVCVIGGVYIYPPTLMNVPFSIYAPPISKMPPVGSRVKFTVSRTAFVAGTTTKKGTLPPDTRIVRGYDPKFQYRILVNSASVGNGVAVALYDVTGKRIDGWQQV